MKKVFKLLSLSAIISTMALASSTVDITATLDVIDPTAEVAINLSSTAMAFGDQLIVPGDVNSPTPITVTLEGTKAAKLTVPKTVQLSTTSGSNINLFTTLTSPTSGTVTDTGTDNELDVTLVDGTPVTADLGGQLKLTGTELSGLYTGIINLSAAYN